MDSAHAFEPMTYVFRFAATIFFVALNGFFVAAEFALVKVRATRIESLADEGLRSAKMTHHILGNLNRYLSACQLGITLASLILGWLAEPAIAELLLAGVGAMGGSLSPDDPIVHGVALVIALTVITGLHMVFGEQAPKIWAIQRPEATALHTAYLLRFFAVVFHPLIWVINDASNRLLRLLGLTPVALHDGIHDVSELRQIVATAAQSGHISPRQSQLAQNVLGIMNMEARHILVPRPDVQYLSLQKTFDENLEAMNEGGHSRYPLCETDLDTVFGIVHTRDLVRLLTQEPATPRDLKSIARDVVFVPETQPLSRVIVTMQNTRNHIVVVVDEHGSSVGLAFLEDALEEIVGPLADEFDDEESSFTKLDDGSIRIAGNVALPKAVELLGLADINADAEPETIAGMVTSELGRLPKTGDRVQIERFNVTIEAMSGRRIQTLRFAPRSASGSAPGAAAQK